jgi:hypothetical protein
MFELTWLYGVFICVIFRLIIEVIIIVKLKVYNFAIYNSVKFSGDMISRI